MKREAFKMYLKPGCEAEYEKRHAAIWPELKALLSKTECRTIRFIGIRRPISCLLSRKRKVRPVRRTWVIRRLCRMVGLYGGYHGSESGQLTGVHSFAGSIPHGLIFCN